MSTTISITVPVPSRRTLMVWFTALLLLCGGVWAVSAYAASTSPSNAGVATVAKGKKVVTVPAGMDLTAESKAQATAMTASTVGVRSVVANTATDTLKITLTGRAKKAIRVSWSVTNGSHPADSVDLAALDARMTALDARMTALEAAGSGTGGQDVTALQARVAALEATLAGVSRVDFQGQPTLRISGVNVQVVDGQDDESTAGVNGRGNLIIGWNEVGGSPLRTGSHNLVVGPNHDYTSFGGLLAGTGNTANGANASISGWGNRATGFANSVAGWGNTASGHASSVSGGWGNTASGDTSSISGGWGNTASGYRSSVTGGWGNTARGELDSVVGGDGVMCDSAGKHIACGEGAFQGAGD